MRIKAEVNLNSDQEKKFMAIMQKCFSGSCRSEQSINHVAAVLLEMGIEHYYEKIVLKKEGT